MSRERFTSVAQAEALLNKSKVKVANKIITLGAGAGLTVLAAVDFLKNYHGYIVKLTA